MKFYKTNTGVYISTPLEYSQYEQITEAEYYENVPPIHEDDEEATTEDYEAALAELGMK